jgi:hypothetical protein
VPRTSNCGPRVVSGPHTFLGDTSDTVINLHKLKKKRPSSGACSDFPVTRAILGPTTNTAIISVSYMTNCGTDYKISEERKMPAMRYFSLLLSRRKNATHFSNETGGLAE